MFLVTFVTSIPALALFHVAARIVECVFIAAGIFFVLGIVTLRQDDPGASSLAVSLSLGIYCAVKGFRLRPPAPRAAGCVPFRGASQRLSARGS